MNTKNRNGFNCPNCGESIEISEVLTNQIRNEIHAEHEQDKKNALSTALNSAEQKFGRKLKDNEARLSIELADMQAQLAEKSELAAEAQQQELDLRKKSRLLEQKQREVDVELQRRLDSEEGAMVLQIKEQMDKEYHLQLKEKEKQIEDLRKSVAEVKRKSEVGSQERQGEILEMDIEQNLSRAFPMDSFSPVSKGVRGADILHEIRNEIQQPCGTIIWEAKNAKRWNSAWMEKLKDDQRNSTATFAVLVTSVLPEGMINFGQIDGVWVSDVDSYIGLTIALRQHLVDITFARKASQGKNEKVEIVYQYLAGEEFKQRIEAIVESFNAMQEQLLRERRAMEKIWKEREKQIQRITTNTVGMYGEMRGIIGSSLPTIQSLELDDE